MPEYSVVGKRVTRVDAVAKATGKALYTADISLPDMLCGKILWSPYPHARIRRLDIGRALKLKGVMAIVTGADAPDQKDEVYPSPMTCCLAKTRVFFAGQPVAAVAAINTQVAEEALELIEVDYEELPSVIDVLEAIKPEAPLVHPDSYTENLPREGAKPSNIFWEAEYHNGDPEAGFKEADIILENTYRTQTVNQGYLEPRAAVASVSPDGKVSIWADSQGIFGVKELVAHYLHLPMNQVKVNPVEVGGAFGGKSFQVASILCAMLSRKTGRPVKIVTSREEVLKTTRPAPALATTVKVGVKKDGRITGAIVSMVYDFGALHGMEGLMNLPGGYFAALGAYRVPNLQLKCFSVHTHKIPSGPYRAPGAAQAAFAVESHFDSLARVLEMDPLEFRLKNIAEEGDILPSGMPLPKIGFKETLERVRNHLSQRGQPEGANRGRGIACGYWAPACGAAGVNIHLNCDATVELVVGSCDLSGTRTTAAQMAAEELGLPFENVTVVAGDTETAPYAFEAVGSMTTRTLAKAIHNACEDIKDQLCRKAAPQLGAEPFEVEYFEASLRVKSQPQKSIALLELIRPTMNLIGGSQIIGQGSSNFDMEGPVLSVDVVDVEVDRETGKVKILSFMAAQDVGLAVNPTLVEGQMQGAVAQGIGWALTENYIFRKGVMQNATLLDYRMPTAADLPMIETLLVEVNFNVSPFGLRGVGEPPLVPTMAAIANAVYSAAGVRMKELPMTPESVYWALHAKS